MGGNNFPHDGEHGRSCTGYGCDCDEKNYGYHSGGRKVVEEVAALGLLLQLL